MNTIEQQATRHQESEVKKLVAELSDKSYRVGYIEGQEEGYAEGYANGFEEANPDTTTPADKDHGSELDNYGQEVETDDNAIEFCCEIERRVDETISAVRALLINGADNIHVERIDGDFHISSEQVV